MAILHFITDEEGPASIVATVRDALAPGSFLALSHATADFHPPGAAGQAVAVYENATASFVPRSLDQVTFFDGFDLTKIGIYADIGRKSLASP